MGVISVSDEIEIVGEEDHPPEASVKLHGPPGTGKTTQTIERLRTLLDDGYGIGDVAFITYRRSMAEEFLRRLYEEEMIEWSSVAKPYAGPARYIGTLHAVANRLADLPSPSEEGSSPEAHKSEFCKDRFGVRYYKPEEEANPTPGELMFSARSWCIENRVEFDNWHKAPQYTTISETWRNRPPLADFHHEWEDYKSQRGISDFEDMLLEVDRKDLAPPGDVIAIDEYHDFTPLQHSIASTWMESAEIVIVNGDPLQVVYSYKGADPSFYTDLDLPEVLLPQSYRVPSRIWRYAGEALRPQHEPPEIQPREADGDIEVIESARLGSDTNSKLGHTTRPEELVEHHGHDIMFLARTNSQLRDVGQSLRDAGVIFRSGDGAGGWNHAEKRLAIYNALKGLEGVDPPQGHTGQKSLKSGWSDRDGGAASNVKLEGSEWWRFLDRVPAQYLDSTKKRLKAILSVDRGDQLVSAEELAEHFTPTFWRAFTDGSSSAGNLLQYSGTGAIRNALDRYDSMIEIGDIEPRVATIHASKGGEAGTVVLYDGIPQRTANAIAHTPAESKNEARLWYVGCTRASERLVIARNGWEWTHEYLPPARKYAAGEVMA